MNLGRGFAAIVLLLWGVLVAGSAALLPRVRVENPPDQWSVQPPSPEQRLWRFTKDQFGQRELLLVGLRREDGSTARLLAAAETLEVWLAAQPEIASVFGPAEARRIVRRVSPFVASPSTVRLLRDAVLSEDRKMALVYVSFRSAGGSRGFQSKASVVSRVERAAASLLPPGTRVLLAGQPAVNSSLQELIRRDAFTAVPLALSAMLVVLVLATGLASLGPLVAVSAALLALLGGLALFGVPLSAATIVVLPITAVVGLSYSAYVLTALSRTPDRLAALREASPPLLWVYSTTAVSILSFVFTPVPALRVYSVATVAGITLAALAAMSLLPALRRGAGRVRLGRPARILGRSGYRLYSWSARRARWAAAMWIALALVSAAGLSRLRLEPNNFLSFFPRGHKVLTAHEELDRSFGGSIPVEVLARTRAPDAPDSPLARERLRRFVAETRRLSRVGPALTPPGRLAARLGTAAPEGLDSWFQARDPHYTRAVFSVPVRSTDEARALFRSLDSLAAALSGPEIRLRVTGVLPSSIALLQTLVDIEVSNLGGLLVVMFAVLAIAARGLRAGGLLLVPNLVPLLAVGGAMGWMGVALDFTTITILSMLLGVAADNTIHLRWAVRREPSRPRHDPVPWAVRRVATPATLTAATTVAGFGILVLSPFPASQRVGLYMAIGLAVAWLADMTLAPLLVSFERRRWRSRDRDGMERLERQRRGDSELVIAEHASHGHRGGREEDG